MGERKNLKRPLEHLSKRQRAATPLPFAEYLLSRVRATFGVWTVSVLWVHERSVYHTLPGCDCWPVSRDAFLFAGPGPIICHPPCGPWGKYRSKCHQSQDHGIRAMQLVEQYGGVVEQPVGSRLFREYGRWWAQNVEEVDQHSYGHQAQKLTLLYWCYKTGSEPRA